MSDLLTYFDSPVPFYEQPLLAFYLHHKSLSSTEKAYEIFIVSSFAGFGFMNLMLFTKMLTSRQVFDAVGASVDLVVSGGQLGMSLLQHMVIEGFELIYRGLKRLVRVLGSNPRHVNML